MDSSKYQSTKTHRGYTYHYYHHSAHDGKPTLLFLHGFPSTSKDWTAQVVYFSERGYGLVIPNLLGYGESSHPPDAAEYLVEPMAEDLNDILEDLGLQKVIVIGHDWGCVLTSRLWNLHPERFLAIGFLAIGYTPPTPDFEYEKQLEQLKQAVGYDVFGYQEFFANEGAAELCTKNIDSFYSLVFPHDHKLWKTDLAPKNKAREWIEQNKLGPVPAWWTEAAKKEHQNNLLKGGFVGPLNYYTAMLKGWNRESDSRVPQEKYHITVPAWFGATLQDYICLPFFGKGTMSQFAKNTTICEFDTGHWVMLEKPNELNVALEEWLKTVA